MEFLVLIISFLACVIGAICGLGGGVIIKPSLDAFGVVETVKQAGFLSCCTVLAMSTYSMVKNLSAKDGEKHIDIKSGTALAVAAALGGVIGKTVFKHISAMLANPNMVGGVQALVLFILTFLTMIYTINKSKIKGLNISGIFPTIVVGFCLGTVSSFLGIGGGPINLMVLYFFFSMPSKKAAANSLYIIFFSQLASLIMTFINGVPSVNPVILIAMMACGLVGAIIGKKINKKIDEAMVDKLFIGLMVVIMCINLFNVYKFLIA